MEKREFFRIDDKLAIEYRVIDKEEFARLRNIIRCDSSRMNGASMEMHFTGDSLSRTPGKEHELFITYLKTIDKKLDMIINLLDGKKKGAAYNSLFTNVNISGSGIKFISDMPLEDGDLIELKIEIPFMTSPKIMTVGQIVRSVRLTSPAPGNCETAVKFLVINDHDRDLIISYMFAKEREELHKKRGDSG